ncbi:MAG: precorrin-6A reductase [Lachnospiraceae bacterium]|nr:precorrin-6A reductase [Lachnospiraceae bacterium]
MSNVVIFGGTTEGRILSEMLSRAEIRHTVCVATDYGKEAMDEDPFVRIRVGRMDRDEMTGFLGKMKESGELKQEDECIVIDVTHPYAREATANIKSAACANGIRYIRVTRDKTHLHSEIVHEYEDIAECARSMDGTQGNILLTTGTRELGEYFENTSKETGGRTFVRVLPCMESIRICEKEGVDPGHVIALQGPFSRELNEAIIKQYDIKHLITKDSGIAGGCLEKIEAARNTGTDVHMIKRPEEEAGVSVIEAFGIVSEARGHVHTGYGAPDHEQYDAGDAGILIYLIGMGMGDPDCMTLEAARALKDCDAVFGAKRLVRNISHNTVYDMYKASDIIPVLEKGDIYKAAIVFSGDTGFYSGAKGMIRALKEWKKDIRIRVIPGISSIAFLASRLGESYEDACLVSLHGKNMEKDLIMLADKVRYHDRAFVLLSDAGDVKEIAGKLIDLGIEGNMTIGLNLSSDDELIEEMTLTEALEYDGGGIATLFIRNHKPEKRPLINVKKDSEFIRDKIPMTKECIRHESIIRLGLKEGDVFYDIGGGTGSVAIEAASLHQSLQVFTIEKNPEAVRLINENIKKADLCNVTVIEGDAETVLTDMDKPDCVFIGGSGGKLREIISILHSKGNGIRYVINAVTFETTEEVRSLIRDCAPEDEECVMISVSDVKQAGSYHMMRAQDPVWIFSFTL